MATSSSSDDSETPPVADDRTELQDAVPKAAETLAELLDAGDERMRIRAAEAILDRAGVTKAKRSSIMSAKEDVGGEVPDYKQRGPDLDDLL